MCKKLLRLLTTALILGIVSISCNETFAPDVYFGNKNYVNDYSALAEQVKTISDRIDLLNKILNENLDGVKVSIDDNTKAILAHTDKMSDDLGNVIATLFNGFSALNCKINSLGEKIVYAINEQGDIIALRIKENGVLVNSCIEANVGDLLKAINTRFSSIESRYEALNEAIKVGLATFEVKVIIPDEIFLPQLTDISDILKGIDLSILEGFKALNAIQKENGEQIVYAINANGYILYTAINDNGEVISAAIVAQAKDLVKAINNASASLDERLKALNIAIDSGLAEIKVLNDSDNKTLSALIVSLNDLLKGLTTDLFDDFKMLSDTMLENGNKLIKAINANGSKIALIIDKNGKLISASIDDIVESLDELKAILDSGDKTLAQKLDALTNAITNGVNGITCSLDKQTNTLSLKLGEVQCAIFQGFSTISTKLCENNCTLMYALDKAGQLISVSIDQNGELLAAKFQCTVKQLVDAINSHNGAFADKISALCTAIESGLASVNVSLGNIGGLLNMEFTNLNEAVKGIKDNVLEGYKLLSLVEFENGEKIAKAIDDNGNKVAFTINSNGQLISVKLDGIIEGLEDLIAAIEDQTKCLEEKFNFLNKAIADGTADITLAIEQQTKTLKLKIGEVSTSLLEGFSMLKETIITEDEKIIYAINGEGQVISVAISNEGALLRATVAGLADDLVKAVNDAGSSLGKRLKALTDAVVTGLAGIEVKIGAVGDELVINFKDLNDAVKDLDATILNGFKLSSSYMLRNGEIIARAINDNGDKIAISIDKNGKLLEVKLADVITSINELAAALADDNEQLNDKLDMLNKAIADGFEGISAAFNNSTKKITLKLGDIQSTLFDGFEGLKKVITTEGDGIIYAVNTNGEVIAAKIKENGDLVSAAIAGNTGDIVKAINDQTTGLRDCIDYLNFMVQTGLAGIEVKIGDVGGMLDIRLTDINKTLKGLKSGVLEGFSLLGTEIGADNQTIVDAINGLGEKISLTINEKGELIHIDLGNIAEGLRDLIAYLENADNGIADKIDALNKAIADKIAEVTAAITGETGLISAALGNVSLSFLNGFTALNSKFDDLGNNIASAINKQGEGIILKIDEKGNLLNATMALGADAIVNALKDQNKGLADKLDALNDALAENFLGLSADLDAVTGAIKMNYNMLSQIDLDLHADLQAIKDALDKIFGELVVLNTTTGQNGEKIVTALNANGDAIKLQIKASGELIDASLDENTTALINALKDQNVSLEAKLGALGDIIEEGLANIKVELGNLYGELKLDLGGLGDIIKEGFKGVTGGLTELKTQMNADGTAIVNAITGKGDLIQGQIDASGKLIEAAIKANTKDIKDALTAQATGANAIADKVAALNTTVETGLGKIEAKIDAQTGEIKTGYEDLSGKLGTIGTNILNGFNGTHADLDAIKAAIIGLKDQLTIDINANTQAILTLDGDLKTEFGKLAQAVEGIGGDIVLAINGQKEAIVLALGPDGSIVGAINAGAVKIADAIGTQTASLTALLNDADGGLPAILKALGTADKDIKDILDFLKTKPDVDLSEIIELLSINNKLLTELLAISDGIYLDPKDKVDDLYNYIYITADVREAADKTAEVEEGLLSLLVGKSMAEPSKKQWCKETPTSSEEFKEHSHCFWKKVDEAKPYLKYANVTTDVDNKSLLKMEKYYSESSWELKIHDVCSYAHIYSIQINDARDMDHYVQYYMSELTQNEAGNKANWNKGYVNEKSGTTYMGPLVVKFVSYDKATGVYCDSPNVRVYCQLAGTGQGSSKDISPQGKCKDGTPYPDGTYSENMPDDGYWTSKPWTSLTKVGDTPIATFDK